MGTDFEIKPDERDFRELKEAFDKAPKEMRKLVKKTWKATGTKIVKQMRASNFQSAGGNSLAFRSKHQRKGSPFKHIKSSLKVKKVVFSGRASFGGYMVIGYTGAKGERQLAHFIAMFHEFGTGNRFTKNKKGGGGRRYTGSLKARAPQAAAWAAAGEGDQIINDTVAAVEATLKSMGG
jgi:hypothetical protein